jgi:DNA-binding GntR family transcriptional regulator
MGYRRGVIDRRYDRALYQQLADHLRNSVQQGVYKSGAVLPSEGALARDYGVGRAVVRRALAILRQEGLITVVRGMNAVVRQPAERRQMIVHSGDELIGRMPTEYERIERHMDYGVPLLEIKRQSGIVELFAGDQVVITGPTP